MRLPVRSLPVFLLLFFLVPAASAQIPPFGAPFPLSNTRYGTAAGVSLLRSDGHDAFLFWTDGQLRVTRLLPGEQHTGRPVFDRPVASTRDFDVVWTGAHFLVAASFYDSDHGYRILGRIVEATGQPAGEPFTITEGLWPRMAFNGRHVLMVYGGGSPTAMTLSPDGLPTRGQQEFPGYPSGPAAIASNGREFLAILPGFGSRLAMFDENGLRTSDHLISDEPREFSLASDGDRFLAVFAARQTATAYLLDRRGDAIGAPLALNAPENEWYRNSDAAWTGSQWAVTYGGANSNELRVVQLDSAARSVLARQVVPGSDGRIAASGGRVVVAWSGIDAIYASELPLQPERVLPVSFAATQQRLLTTATSATATLVVWAEYGNGRNSIRAGVRTRDGRWSEREIALTAGRAIAASDGREFVVILDDTVIRLDAMGRPVPFGFTRVVDFRPTGIAWDGHNFGLVGADAGVLRTALLTPAGVVTEASILPLSSGIAAEPRIASNGNGFLATWLVAPPCGPVEEFCVAKGLAGVHLDPNAHAIESTPIVLERDDGVFSAGVAWNGHRYVVAWSSGKRGIVAAHLSTSLSPTRLDEVILGEPAYAFNVTVDPLGDAVVVGWGEGSDTRIAIVNDNGSATTPATIHRDPSPRWLVRFATFPDGTIQFVWSTIQHAAPHHGTAHVMMSVGTFALPPLPDAPRLTARREDGAARLEWPAPPQRVNGYRVEYRVGDGLWNEVETWLDADRRTLLVNLPWRAATYTFRVRAFNDAGTGAYSPAVVVNPGRRRVVR